MSKFIKLTNSLINTNYIHSIIIKPHKYCIHIVSNRFEGGGWNIAGFGFGTISSYNYEIELCEIKHSSDYKIVSQWIDNH